MAQLPEPRNVALWPARLQSLDVLRFFAALVVVVSHWLHFARLSDASVPEPAQPPWPEVLWPIYQRGFLAVDLFFILSGFIFYWLYSESIARGAMSAREFFLLRLSRLYPLHILTLGLVALGQVAHHALTGGFFVFNANDAYHFVLNLLFMSSWGLEHAASFNFPVWSVSVEVLVYACFFVLTLLAGCRPRMLVLAIALGVCVFYPVYWPVGRGIAGFFLGGLVFLLASRLLVSRWRETATKWLLLGTALAWMFTILGWYGEHRTGCLASLMSSALDLSEGVAQAKVRSLNAAWLKLVVFPATILTLAMAEARGCWTHSALGSVGDLSYSIYMIHFPVQLALVVVLAARGDVLPDKVYGSPVALLLFVLLLAALAVICHKYFEVPMRRHIRRKFQ